VPRTRHTDSTWATHLDIRAVLYGILLPMTVEMQGSYELFIEYFVMRSIKYRSSTVDTISMTIDIFVPEFSCQGIRSFCSIIGA
jgi:hypothetical protein